MRAPIPPMVRFYRHVRREGDCLIWTSTAAGAPGYKRPTFQASTRQSDGKVYAHRWIYEQRVGPIPSGFEVDHTCKRGLCVEIAHLEAVTSAENYRRERLLVCTSGRHDLSDPDNCRWDSQGRRRGCKLCKRESALARYHKIKGGQ